MWSNTAATPSGASSRDAHAEGLIDAAQASMDLLIESLPNRDDGGPSACIQSDRPLASGRKAPTI